MDKKQSQKMKQDWRVFFFKIIKYTNIFLKYRKVENGTIYIPPTFNILPFCFII